jgi:hypothetical protein
MLLALAHFLVLTQYDWHETYISFSERDHHIISFSQSFILRDNIYCKYIVCLFPHAFCATWKERSSKSRVSDVSVWKMCSCSWAIEMLGNITLVLYKFRSFRRGAGEDSVLHGYDSALRDNRIPTVRGNVLHSSSRFEMSVFIILVLPDAINILSPTSTSR